MQINHSSKYCTYFQHFPNNIFVPIKAITLFIASYEVTFMMKYECAVKLTFDSSTIMNNQYWN